MLVVLPMIILQCLDSEGESCNVPQHTRTDPALAWLVQAGLPTCPDCKQQVRVKLCLPLRWAHADLGHRHCVGTARSNLNACELKRQLHLIRCCAN